LSLHNRLERLRGAISASQPLELEAWVRSLLIQFWFHTSNRAGVQLVGEGPNVVTAITPVVFKGQGVIRLHKSMVFGVARSPFVYSASYVESRTPESVIEIGADTTINNKAVILSEGGTIRIGARCLIGPELFLVDANGHDLRLSQRRLPDPKPALTEIGDDVFIGARVMILKGARVGAGSVIAAGAVLAPNFQAPPRSVIAGNPAVVVGTVAD
jgi:acetyltransferase-like isoleucine patch superfamily enzyme